MPRKKGNNFSLASERCEICDRAVNPQMLSSCCFRCSMTDGEDHDMQCNQRTKAEKEAYLVPPALGGKKLDAIMDKEMENGAGKWEDQMDN